EDSGKFLQPSVDPDPAVAGSFTEQERPAHAASDAVIPPSYRGINEVGARNSHASLLVRFRSDGAIVCAILSEPPRKMEVYNACLCFSWRPRCSIRLTSSPL